MNRTYLLLLTLLIVAAFWFVGGHLFEWKIGYDVPLFGFFGIDFTPFSPLIVGVGGVIVYHLLTRRKN